MCYQDFMSLENREIALDLSNELVNDPVPEAAKAELCEKLGLVYDVGNILILC